MIAADAVVARMVIVAEVCLSGYFKGPHCLYAFRAKIMKRCQNRKSKILKLIMTKYQRLDNNDVTFISKVLSMRNSLDKTK